MRAKFNNRGTDILKVPGFNLPIDAWPERIQPGRYDPTHFRHGIASTRPDRLTVREVCMLNFMNLVTDKPDWWDKVFDSLITTKWRDESRADPLLSEAAFDWSIKELKDKAKDYAQLQYVRVLDNATVCVKSDTLIPASLQSQLQAAVKPLLDQSDKDWHPGSNDQVLNLVHPSLYPLVYGRSRVLASAAAPDLDTSFNNIGQGDVVPQPALSLMEDGPGLEDDHRSGNIAESERWSIRFQWLPCEVNFVGDEGTDVRVASYINNLHPRLNPDLYSVVEKLISFSIGPWNDMLYKEYTGRLPPRIFTHGADIEDVDDPDWCGDLQIEPDEHNIDPFRERMQEYVSLPNGPHITTEDQEEIEAALRQATTTDDFMEIINDKTSMRRTIRHPEPGVTYTYEQWKQGKGLKPFIPPLGASSRHRDEEGRKHDFETVSLETDFRQQGLQVIVKLSSIELSPEKPEYGGGNWHLEGKLNEHIVATAIYYYDVENVTESRIRFRQEAYLDGLELSYEQDDHDPLCMIYGTESMRHEPAVQEIGSIKTCHGRFLAFSNVCQHRVEPFRLADPTKPGHRRFLVLWLVDPHLRVMSTANVPPQQHAWWVDEAVKAAGNHLPGEITNKILNEHADWPMRVEEAKQLRLDLMAERTTLTDRLESNFESYNLCEH